MRPVRTAARFARVIVPALCLALAAGPAPRAQPRSHAPVVFVHGLGSSAAEVGVPARPGGPAPWGDLLSEIARRYPAPEVCQPEAQPGRPWRGSPCVFRYVEDMAEAEEGGPAARGPNDSQSAVRENAAKLAGEVAEVARRAGRPVILVGYSMGGAIIRTYLALHREAAARNVDAVVLVDAVTSGSWGFALVGAVPARVDGPMAAHLMELLRLMTATTSQVDVRRPAPRDLRPRSELFREVAAVDPPETLSYYTFWGDIRVEIARKLLAYDLPGFSMPSLGDLGLLPGDPDPATLPELGGQRFSPRVAPGEVALDVPHRAVIELSSDTVAELIGRCGRPSDRGTAGCLELVRSRFDVPNTHTAVPVRLGTIEVDAPELGGRMTLLEALLAAVARHQGDG